MSRFIHGFHVGSWSDHIGDYWSSTGAALMADRPGVLVLGDCVAVSDHVASATQRNHIKPMFFLITLVVMMFCLLATISAGATRGARKSPLDNSASDSGTRQRFLGIIGPSAAVGSIANCFPMFCLSITSHASRILSSAIGRFSEQGHRPVSTDLASASQFIGKPFVATESRQRFPLMAGGAYFSFRSILDSVYCGHHALLTEKAPGKLLLVSRKKMPGAAKPRLSELSFCVTR